MNILVVSSGNINDPRGGAGNRAYCLAHYLQRFGNTITVLEPAEESNKGSAGEFKTQRYFGKIGQRSLSAFCDINPFFILKLMRFLVSQNVDLIHVELPGGVAIAQILSTLLMKQVPVVYNSQNLQKHVHRELIEHYKKMNSSSVEAWLIAPLLSCYTNIIEKLAVKLADMVLCVSSNDAGLFVNEYGIASNKLKVVPNGTRLRKTVTAEKNKARYGLDIDKISVVFHGAYEYPPNAEAVALIENVISPSVIKEHAEVEFVVAGLKTEEGCKNPMTVCLGYVEDIFSLLKSCDIAIVPIVKGGGTRLKVLDYLGAGLPMVTTRKGTEGIDVINGEEALIVDEINREFIDALLYLIGNAEERERIGRNAANLAKEYDWRRIAHRLNAFYKELID